MKKTVINLNKLHAYRKRMADVIKKHAKACVMAAALVGASYAVSEHVSTEAGIGMMFTFGLVGRIKAKGVALDEETENLLKEIDAEATKAFNDVKEGTISKTDYEAQKAELLQKVADAADVTKLMYEGKSVASIIKEQGEELARFADGAGNAIKGNDLKALLREQAKSIEDVFKKKSGHITLEIKLPAVMTTDNTVDFDTNSIPVEAMESFSLGAYAAKRYGKQFIAELADRTTVTDMEKYTIWDEEGDVEGAFAIVAEGALKPLLSADIVKNFAEAQKVAGKYVVTEEFAKFFKRAYQIIQRIIRDKMIRDYEALLRTGLASVAASYTGTALDGTIVDPNNFDAIGAVAAQIESLNFIPDTIVLNPVDKWAMRLTKDTEGRYIVPITVTLEDGITRIWEFRVVTSTYQTQGTFTLAESGLFKIEEEAMSVRMGYGINVTTSEGNVTAVESDFDHNRFRVIVETWFKQYLPTPYVGSVVTASFNTVKTALEFVPPIV